MAKSTRVGGGGLFTPREHAGAPWHRRPMIGYLTLFLATAVGTLTGFLGPSVVTLQLGPRRNLLPPWYLPVDLNNPPNEWVVVLMCVTAVLLGGVGTVIWLRALRAGWQPSIPRMALFCLMMIVAAAVVPPMTSADSLMYAAYGRIQLIGMDPYSITPAELFRQQWDPIVRWSERPWQDTPSVYGPVLMGAAWLANRLAGSNTHDVIFAFQMQAMVGMIICVGALLWLARRQPAVQARVLAVACCHPMVWAVVVGAHNEAVIMALVMCGLLAARRYPIVTGVLVGLATAGKATAGVYGLAFIWAYRREPVKLVAFLVGSGIPVGLAYLVIYPQALELAVQNAGYVAGNAWVRPLALMFDPLLGPRRDQQLLSVVGWALTITLVWMLSRLLPWTPAPGLARGVDPRTDPLTIACRTAVTITAGWTMTSLYSLPWYDLLAFLPLAFVGASMLDWVLIWRVVMLNAVYVPGRVVLYSDALRNWALRGREILAATGSALIIGTVILWWYRAGQRSGSFWRAPVPEGFPEKTVWPERRRRRTPVREKEVPA